MTTKKRYSYQILTATFKINASLASSTDGLNFFFPTFTLPVGLHIADKTCNII